MAEAGEVRRIRRVPGRQHLVRRRPAAAPEQPGPSRDVVFRGAGGSAGLARSAGGADRLSQTTLQLESIRGGSSSV
jgi:hypothetical protein